MTYETSIKRLEEIVSALEQGGLSLEESLDLYKEGTELSVECKKMLENAKLQIKTISEDENE